MYFLLPIPAQPSSLPPHGDYDEDKTLRPRDVGVFRLSGISVEDDGDGGDDEVDGDEADGDSGGDEVNGDSDDEEVDGDLVDEAEHLLLQPLNQLLRFWWLLSRHLLSGKIIYDNYATIM